MKKIYLTILYYLVACLFILAIDTLSPTTMAAPGLDIVVFFVAVIVSVVLLGRSIIKVHSDDKLSYGFFFANVIGTIAVMLILYRELNKIR